MQEELLTKLETILSGYDLFRPDFDALAFFREINAVIEGVKSKIDLKSLGLEDLDVSKAGGIIDKIKGLFGK